MKTAIACFRAGESHYFGLSMRSVSGSHFLVNALPLLLHDHDCLVIPGLGGFLAHPVAARYDADKGEWIPPGRDVVFNPKLTVRDGLMEQEIRRATGCSTEAAGSLIDQEVEAIQSQLVAGEHVDFPGLGRLFQQEGSQAGFAAEPRLGERYAPPGLGRIPWLDRWAEPAVAPEAETAEHPTPETETPPVVQAVPTEEDVPTDAPSAWKTPLRIAAVLALPLMVTGSVLWSSQITTGFNLFDTGSGLPTEFTPRIEGEDIRFPELADSPLPFVQAGAPEVVPVTEATMPVPQPQAISSGCTHHVIAGTFAEAARAAELARRFQALGYASTLLPGPNGMQRVSAGCFDGSADAARFRRSLIDHHGFQQAWVFAP